jgi:iron complex outermembrane receptor protein
MREIIDGGRLRLAIRGILMAAAGGALCAPVHAADPAAAEAGLEEIVVTATRREESVIDIPYSISAISGTTLEEQHVQSLSDLTKLITGISFVDQGPTSRSNFVLRGINANSTDHPSVNTVAPVSTYIGETPLFLSLQIDDLDRVEVLKGPQGTLYGSGSLAGTLRFIPNKPNLDRFEANVEGDVADVAATKQYDHSFSGMLNVPLGAISALRFAAGFEHYAGFINENYIVKLGPPSTAVKSPVGIPVSGDPNNPLFGPMVFTPIQGANTTDRWHTRLSYLLKPGDNLSVLVTYYHQDDLWHGVQAASPYFHGSVDATRANNPFYAPNYPVSFPTGGVVFPQNGPYDTNDSFLLVNHRIADLGAVDVNLDLGFATLTSSTSYYKDRGSDVSDGTGYITRIPQFYGFIPRMVDYETDYDSNKGFVEEIRLVSQKGRALDYVAGVFLQHLIGSNGQNQWIPGQSFYSNLYYTTVQGYSFYGSDYAAYGDRNYIVANTTDFLDRALFGELTWHVTDRWQVTGGARVFKQGFSTNAYSALPYCGSLCGTGILGVTDVVNGYDVNDHIVKLDTSYKLADQLNLYADYSEGFRRGGANGIPITGPFAVNPALLVYTPDKSKNYEVGIKGAAPHIEYTADVFWIDWNNFQLDTQSFLGGYPMAVNGRKARSRGLELSLDGRFGGFGWTLGYAYTDATVAQNFSILDNAGGGQVASIVTGHVGDQLPNAPRNTANLDLNYTHAAPFSSDWSMRWDLAGSYRSATLSQLLNTAPGTPAPFVIEGFEIWSGSVSLHDAHGLHVDLYAENIFNQLGVTGGQDAGEVGIRAAQYYVGRPRTVGIRVGYQMK